MNAKQTLLWLTLCLLATILPATGSAQNSPANRRYVSTDGKYSNDGREWASAKNNIQDAINDLVDKGQVPGEVWVASGEYKPTESTEASGGSTLYMAFKIPAGITVRGGFLGQRTLEEGEEITTEGTTYKKGQNFPGETTADQRVKEEFNQQDENGETHADWHYKYRTELTGDLANEAKFEWNPTKNRWNTSFYGNCYHVVWFATNGFKDNGRAKPLDTSRGMAQLEGCVVKNGNAKNTDLDGRTHNAYGGGIYMVEGSRVENCRITNCEASRDGGGVYMDGGGILTHSYVTNCQALGLGVQYGYGGGICMEHNGSGENFGAYRSVVVGCVGRMGGGAAIRVHKDYQTEGTNGKDLRYRPFFGAVLVANNTATTEGGGVYMDGGGIGVNMSIVNNVCNGSGVVSNGMATGRAGGLYCRDHSVLLNSVLWGNECGANNDIQYASSRSDMSDPDLNVKMQYCALELSDNVDWSGTTSFGVFNLSRYNKYTDYTGAEGQDPPGANDMYANFMVPSPKAGYNENISNDNIWDYNWVPGSNSALANAGLMSLDLDADQQYPFQDMPVDILGIAFTARSTLGAYNRNFVEMIPNLENTNELHFYVDPNDATDRDDVTHGISWDMPARYLNNVIWTIRKHWTYNAEDKTGTYKGIVNGANETQHTGISKLVIHVKEGTMPTTNSYTATRAREMSINIPSGVTLMGGYPARLEGTDISDRNPLWYPTVITGDINEDYNSNVAHLVTLQAMKADGSFDIDPSTGSFALTQDVIIDGFQLRNANPYSLQFGGTSQHGGGLAMVNVENVQVRNVLIAGCTAINGAAVYTQDARNTTFENCIFHNNEGRPGNDSSTGATFEQGSIVFTNCDEAYKDEESYDVKFYHCNVMNNVGHATRLWGHRGQRWENSIFYANTRYNTTTGGRSIELTELTGGTGKYTFESYVTNTEQATKLMESGHILNAYTTQGVGNTACVFTASRCLFDSGTLFGDNTGVNTGVNNEPLTVPGSTTQIRLSYNINSTENNLRYPRFVNTVTKVGVQPGGDLTFYGRAVSFEPHNENPMVNAALHSGEHDTWGKDMSDVTTRDYGGLPDIGAIENHAADNASTGQGRENAYEGGQPAYGSVIYVKTAADGGNDSNSGLSWSDPLASVQAAIEKARVVHTITKDQNITVNVDERISDLKALQEAILQGKSLRLQSASTTSRNWYRQNNEITAGNGNYTEFVFVPVEDNPDEYYIHVYDADNNTDNDYYITGGVRNNSNMQLGTTGSKQRFTLEYVGGNFAINNVSATGNDKYVNLRNDGYAWRPDYQIRAGSKSTNTSSWRIIARQEFTYIETQTTVTEIPSENKQVWVAAGTYTQKSDDATHALKDANITDDGVGRANKQKFSILLREGVNVYGGFPAVGSPGFDDRNPKDFQTTVQPGDPIKDINKDVRSELGTRGITGEYPLEYRAHSTSCGSYGRVVVQEKDFETETVFDGFTITNGYLNSTARVNINGQLYNVMANSNNQVGLWGGAGVYLKKNGVLENCIVKDNMTYANPEESTPDASTSESNHLTFMAITSNDGCCHTVGAGVYNNGGIIKNCEISHNIVLFELERRNGYDGGTAGNRYADAAGLYGAGLFQEDGTVYNTIIHDNILKVTNMKGKYRAYYKGGYYDNPYKGDGITNNEYWPDNNSTESNSPKYCNQFLAGAGVFIVKGDFYNNTVVKNTYRLWPTYYPGVTTIGIGGVYAYNGAKLYNCIIADNEPASPEDAGLVNPHDKSRYLGNRSTSSYINFPIICFNTSSNSYSYADANLTVRSSAVDYKSAAEIWPGVNYKLVIRNQCLNRDEKANSLTAYTFSHGNSYGYAPGGEECNPTSTDYSNYSGTNWYGKGKDDESMTLYDSETYQLKAKSKAMNTGRDVIDDNNDGVPDVTIPDKDAKYTERIKDCRIDMGAYEFDDAYRITPDDDRDGATVTENGTTVTLPDSAFYYVTPNGRGLASAEDPDNAACASKLQRVLDAAGRYKFLNPDTKVIVKVANSKDWQSLKTDFKYYATRSTDKANSDVRIWSIIVPRGVEVWGGYTDTYQDTNNNGFYTIHTIGEGENQKKVYEDKRDVTGNPTYFDAYYTHSELDDQVWAYHVVTFTDQIFDGDGNPYVDGDVIGGESSYKTDGRNQTLMSMTDKGVIRYLDSQDNTEKSKNVTGVTDRAVIDGIYITGGQADQKASGSDTEAKNINSYGGAAIVTDYAHVRNCIVRNNSGTYGGALALTDGALVSGCLIDQNEAEYGGAIYVFPNNTMLSDGTTVEHVKTADGTTTDNMPFVFTTTIANNSASKQGGGVWYSTNEAHVRFNSTVIWSNHSSDQANVRGLYNMTYNEDSEQQSTAYYPFNYCALQNIRATGLNNVSLGNYNEDGTRFHKDGSTNADDLAAVDDNTGYAQFGLYNLTNYSMLVNGGMPWTEYEGMMSRLGLDYTDFSGTARDINEKNSDMPRENIEIGALAFDKVFKTARLMMRLFVAEPGHVKMDAASTMMASDDAYYSQEGSSFAYPMQRLQDALNYIRTMRELNEDGTALLHTFNADGTPANGAAGVVKPNDIPFEIFLSGGTYYPTMDLTKQYKSSVGNTFLIPEGVSLIGGNAVGKDVTTGEGEDATTTTQFYGAGYQPDMKTKGNTDYYIANNQTPLTAKSKTVAGYTILQEETDNITKHREPADVNANSILEPWEFKNTTILSGYMTGVNNPGVNHVITIMANQDYTGALPSTVDTDNHSGGNVTAGYECFEHGQPIALDGITIEGGYAYGYQEDAVSDAHKLKYSQGGAILVDGNRYFDKYNKQGSQYIAQGISGVSFNEEGKEPDYHTGTENDQIPYNQPAFIHSDVASSVGFRDIDVVINRCRFVNNTAGYGGAISSNTTLDIFNSAFERNLARSGVDASVKYGETTYTNISYPGNGGAIYATHQLTAVNTLFANNEASDDTYSMAPKDYKLLYMAIAADRTKNTENPVHAERSLLGGAGGAIFMGDEGQFHLVNCNFVRNMANAYPVVFTLNPNYYQQRVDANTETGTTTTWERPAYSDYNQIINSVIWGNELNETMDTEAKKTGNEIFDFAARLACNYGRASRGWDNPNSTTDYYNQYGTKYIQTFDATHAPQNQEELDREVPTAAGSSTDVPKFSPTIWFSAYEEHKAKTAKNANDFRDLDYSFTDGPKHIIDKLSNYKPEGTEKVLPYQNCNIHISSTNTANDGPNFVNPSTNAGYAGYLESADWSPARLNNLTDNGWGKLKQDLTSGTPKFVTKGSPAPGDDIQIYDGTGFYPQMKNQPTYVKYFKTITLGDEPYMKGEYAGANAELIRISYDPNPTHNVTYIDMGVYEYPHTELKVDQSEDGVDILWVSTQEKPDQGLPEGRSWEQPTSDLQRAIETLLSSRNNRRKEIRLMSVPGEYFTPVYTIDNKMAFIIDTRHLDDMITAEQGNDNGVTSLTIKGGYSHDLEVYDLEQYPALIRQQEALDESSDRWDYLFYIDDPTQRTASKTAKNQTIPIQFDGVTLINDQSKHNKGGAAIYYADASVYNSENSITSASDAKVTTSYKEIEPTSQGVDVNFETADITDPAKLIISRSRIMTSGNPMATTAAQSAPAVYIGEGGGHALMYNNVLHSNYGQPLVAKCLTRTVNNTFALNAGAADLQAEGSTIHNSVFWKNNGTTNGYGNQFNLMGFNALAFTTETDGSVSVTGKEPEYDTDKAKIFSYNTYTGGPTNSTDYKANTPAGADEEKKPYERNYNTELNNDNNEFATGPNFVNPENEDKEQRNFMMRPSIRLMERGNGENYKYVEVKVQELDATTATSNGGVTTDYNIYDYAALPATHLDAADHTRIMGKAIDLGAYEYQNQLSRVLYVDPNNPVNGNGFSWENAMGYGHLQNAINLAAAYHLNNDEEEAYVFVKGSTTNADGSHRHTQETLTLRNGVNVYGSIAPNLNDECWHQQVQTGVTPTYVNVDIDFFVRILKDKMEGHVGRNAPFTAVNGIVTSDGTTYTSTESITGAASVFSLVDGFTVTPQDKTTAVEDPVINVFPNRKADNKGTPAVALRNIVVYGNTGTGNIAEIDNALIYEALFRDNTPGTTSENDAVLKLGNYGFAVNITAEGKTIGADAKSELNGGTESNSHIYYSLVNFDTDATATRQTLSGYKYPVWNKNLNYQLTEDSKHIDAIEYTDDVKNCTFLPTRLRAFIKYDTDHDLLGNPRVMTLNDYTGIEDINGKKFLDRGAFETWKVEKDYQTEETQTDITKTSDGKVTGIIPAKHNHPHEGSAVYIMEGKTLVSNTDLTPAYLLLKEGASLYSTDEVNAVYVAVERKVNPDGSVVSLPYDMDYTNRSATYNEEEPNRIYYVDKVGTDGVLTRVPEDGGTAYTYDGAGRSAWDNVFKAKDSGHWTEQTTATTTEANHGVMYAPTNETNGTEATTYRFSARGKDYLDYVYQEEKDEVSKTVTLMQYDDRTIDDDAADFTDKGDMGWNCIGLPYLVSNYKTYGSDYTGGAAEYNMNIPHKLWLYYDGQTYPDGTTNADGDGGFYSVDSWDDTATNWHLKDGATPHIWVGEGIFTQTAAVSDTEALTFYRPVYAGTATQENVKTRGNTRYYVSDEIAPQTGITITAHHHTVEVTGLQGGEDIRIYDPAGQLFHHATAHNAVYRTRISAPGVYIVKVNAERKKVLVK